MAERPRPALFRDDAEPAEGDRLELVELLNHVLDKGAVIHGEVTIAVGDIDLVNLDLTLILTSAETAAERARARAAGAAPADGAADGAARGGAPDADARVLPPAGGR